MTAWVLAKCLYMVAGGLVTPAIVSVLFPRAKCSDALSDPIPAFVIAIGALLVWPMLLALLIDSENRK